MRALVVHIAEGGTHILLASNEAPQGRKIDRRAELLRANSHQGKEQAGEEERREPQKPARWTEELHVLHEQLIRNGVDLSLLHRGRMIPDLLLSTLTQTAEAMSHFAELTDEIQLAISASLLTDPEHPEKDGLIADFQAQFNRRFRVMDRKDEALWILRGVRGVHRRHTLSCVSLGHWRTLFACEEPGHVPTLSSFELGSSRLPDFEQVSPREAFPGIAGPADQEGAFLLTGEGGWLLAALHLGLTFHDVELLDSCRLGLADLQEMEELLSELSVEERNMIPMVDQRGDSILEFLQIARAVLQASGRSWCRVCSRGLAHGLASHIFYEGRRNA